MLGETVSEGGFVASVSSRFVAPAVTRDLTRNRLRIALLAVSLLSLSVSVGCMGGNPQVQSTLEQVKLQTAYNVYMPTWLPNGTKKPMFFILRGPWPQPAGKGEISISYWLSGKVGFGIIEFPIGHPLERAFDQEHKDDAVAKKVEDRRITAGDFQGRLITIEVTGGPMSQSGKSERYSTLIGAIGKTGIQIDGPLAEDQLLRVAASLRSVE